MKQGPTKRQGLTFLSLNLLCMFTVSTVNQQGSLSFLSEDSRMRFSKKWSGV